MNRGIRYLLFFSILLGQAEKPPGWEEERLSDTNSYIGISFVEINNRSPSVYQEEADDQAILVISKQIQVKVIGESESKFKQRGLDVEQSYSEENLVYTVSNIKELKKVHDKKIGNEYWVYWKVSIDAYEKSKKAAIQAARNQLVKFINTNNVDVTQKFRFLITALDAINQYPDADFDLQNQVKNELNKLVDRLKLESENDFITGTFDRRIDNPVIAYVTAFIEDYEGMTDLAEVAVNNFPVKFIFSKGKGNFTFQSKRTDGTGKVITQITRITDSRPFQEITLLPDLLKLKPNQKKFPLLDHELQILANSNTAIIELEVLKERSLEVAIYVGSVMEEGVGGNLSAGDLNAINEAFEYHFKEATKWKIRSRDDANKAIRQKGFEPLDACSNYECRFEIVKALNITRLVLISMNYDFRNRILRCTMRLEDVIKDDSEIIHRDKVNIPDGIYDIPEYIEEEGYVNTWVDAFIVKTNPARAEITPFGNQQISMSIDDGSENIFKLPYYDSMFAGIYNINFFSNGYEQKDTTIIAIQGEPLQVEISLVKKSPYKAFAYSIIPGQGQRYSSDIANPGRKKTGLYLNIGGALAILATGYAWYEYDNAVKDYESMKSLYGQQNQMSAINLYRTNSQNANSQMQNQYNIAVSISAATLGFWLGNMVEAILNFPK